MGTMSAWSEFAPAFTRMTGHKLTITQESTATWERTLASGAPSDVIVQYTDAMAGVIGWGKVIEGSSTIFARAAVGISVRNLISNGS